MGQEECGSGYCQEYCEKITAVTRADGGRNVTITSDDILDLAKGCLGCTPSQIYCFKKYHASIYNILIAQQSMGQK